MNRARGFSLVTAMFIMIIVALLVASVARISGQSRQAGVLQLSEARAFQAAQTGLEWGLYQLQGGNCPASPTTFQVGGDLADFQIQVSCARRDYTENGASIAIFDLTSTATRGTLGVDADYVSRQVQLTVEGP